MGVIEKRPQHCGGCNCRGRSYWRGRPAMDSTQLPNVSAVCPAPDSLVEIALHPAYPPPTDDTNGLWRRPLASDGQPTSPRRSTGVNVLRRASRRWGRRRRWRGQSEMGSSLRPPPTLFFQRRPAVSTWGTLGPVTGPTKSSRSLLGSCEGCASLINQRQPSYKFCRVGPSFRDAD